MKIDNKLVLLVTTGYPWSNETRSSEVIDLDDPENKCENLQPFPIEVNGAVGALLDDNTPVICGGADDSWALDPNNANDQCHILGNPTPIVTMQTGRWHADSFVLDQENGPPRLWITGGGPSPGTKSTEYIDIRSGNAIPGPDLPEAMSGHCLVKIGQNSAMLIGGLYYSPTRFVKQTWFFDIDDETWTRGPDLDSDLGYMTCGVITDSTSGDLVVIVAGGRNDIAQSKVCSLPHYRDLIWARA